MSAIPSELAESMEKLVGPLRDAMRLSGGMVASSALVVTERGRFFVKWKLETPRDFFRMEADGLDRLSAAGALRIPRVIGWQDESEGFPYLILEYVEPRPPERIERFNAALGEGLATLHRIRPGFSGFGLESDNYLGSQPQRNTPASDWTTFYCENRLLPQIERARRIGLLPPHRSLLLDLLMAKLDSLFAGHDPEPSLIHGDLWAGNLLAFGDEPVLIDPAVYYADREMEIAYMQLFSGFADEVFEAYESSYRLPSEYAERRPLHQLYPLLIHLNHFGEQYGADIDSVCRYYVSA